MPFATPEVMGCNIEKLLMALLDQLHPDVSGYRLLYMF